MTTTSPHKILNVLQISYKVYDNYREKHYQDYCYALANHFFMSYTLLHRHAFIQNYFHDMWLLHVETAFLQENALYFNCCEAKLLRELFHEYTRNVLSNGEIQMYPQSLLKKIKNDNLQKTAN